METSPRYPLHLNSKSPAIYLPLGSQSKMYSTYHSDSTKSTLETMYTTKQPSDQNATAPTMAEPKKGNIFQNAFNSLTSILVDQLVKVPASLINNFSNVNNTLSVTIVPNEGIISHEFFKSLTNNKDNLADNMQNNSKQNKEPPLNFVEAIRLNNKVHIPKDEFLRITNDPKLPVLDDFDLCLDTEPMFLYEKPFDNKEIITNPTLEKEKSESKKDSMKDKVISKDEIVSEVRVTSLEDIESPNCSSLKETTEGTNSSTTNLFSNMWKKVVNGVKDHCQPYTPGSEGCTKRYQTTRIRRKPNFVSSGRGRGRGKSQLRRNGVSQTRHRKERCKHDICSDIQDDLDAWEELETYTMPLSCLRENEDLEDVVEAEGPSYSLSFELIDIKPKKTKQERKDVHAKTESFSTKVKHVPECPLEEREADCTIDKTNCRPRLISETSDDSEDSFIVFGTESECDFDNFNYSDENDSSDSETESEPESETESENETDDTPRHKVRFNLKPTVHKMIKWDFAYRAARLGPWETIARDRERFKGRINHIGRVIEPILAFDFRTNIWKERFTNDE